MRRQWRRWKSRGMVALLVVCAVLAVLPLAFILAELIIRGASSINLDFFLKTAPSPGESGGGVAHAIVGTLIIVGTACVIGMPIGIGAGIYASEWPGSKLATVTRFIADVLTGTPSIVVGVFAWAWIVAPQHSFSALAGSVALAVIMIPMVMRTTEEMIKLVPHSLREAALALGFPRWRTTLSVMVRTCLPGIVTGALLAVARVAGETAPLLFTALGNEFISTNIHKEMAALPLVVYKYAKSPYDDWHRLAWAAALVLISLVLVLSLASRFVTRKRFRAGS